jgi:hypothetical protein
MSRDGTTAALATINASANASAQGIDQIMCIMRPSICGHSRSVKVGNKGGVHAFSLFIAFRLSSGSQVSFSPHRWR